jgi:hypothetical protein
MFGIAIAGTTVQLLQCKPISANWTMSAASAQCLFTSKIRVTTYAISSKFTESPLQTGSDHSTGLYIATDFICALLPIVFIRQLHRPLREKIVVAFLMGLGVFGGVCGIIKVVLFLPSTTASDFIWASGPLITWT